MIKLIKFEADWCSQCKAYELVLDRIHEDHPEIEIERINIDKEGTQELVDIYQVRSLPTTVILKNGELAMKFSGMNSKLELEAKLQSLGI